jgi:rSAM/selenodomain-associated transferase 1
MPERTTRAPRLLQQFARYPRPGQVKTRLQSALSPLEACAVHEALMLQTAKTLTASSLGPAELWLDSCEEHAVLSEAVQMGMGGPYRQSGGGLGERMYHALRDGLTRAQSVVLVGSDCPDLCRDYLSAAFAALENAEVVLGPADDGGFVLIGCRQLRPRMFANVVWGGSDVLESTQRALQSEGLGSHLLSTLYDVDTPDDLLRWRASQSQA